MQHGDDTVVEDEKAHGLYTKKESFHVLSSSSKPYDFSS